MKSTAKKRNVHGQCEYFVFGTQHILYSTDSRRGFMLGVMQILVFALGLTQILAFLDTKFHVGVLIQREDQMQVEYRL